MSMPIAEYVNCRGTILRLHRSFIEKSVKVEGEDQKSRIKLYDLHPESCAMQIRERNIGFGIYCFVVLLICSPIVISITFFVSNDSFDKRHGFEQLGIIALWIFLLILTVLMVFSFRRLRYLALVDRDKHPLLYLERVCEDKDAMKSANEFCNAVIQQREVFCADQVKTDEKVTEL